MEILKRQLLSPRDMQHSTRVLFVAGQRAEAMIREDITKASGEVLVRGLMPYQQWCSISLARPARSYHKN
jgi:hypothetical protein